MSTSGDSLTPFFSLGKVVKYQISVTEEKNNFKITKTELVWSGKRTKVELVKLPFQTIEIINLPRGRRQESLFDTPQKQEKLIEDEVEQPTLSTKSDEGWENRLIWGDNLLVMGSLLDEFAGKINLIYIDPPFATGQDFSYQVKVGDEEWTKEPSAIEELAYRDTWGKGLESYLQMMYDQLVLMKELLANDGSIYVHLDWHVGHYVKTLLDEIFGKENFRNEIVWKKLTAAKAQSKFFSNVKDCIFLYSRSQEVVFNPQFIKGLADDKNYPYIEEETGRRYGSFDFTQKGTGPARKFGNKMLQPPPGKHWIWSQERIDKGLEDGVIFFTSSGTPRIKRYLDEKEGNYIGDLWVDEDVAPLSSNSSERLNYDTQKPESLLERIIKSSSSEGDLVGDFFCGSGTTAAVAEKLVRKWIVCDIGRFAIHTTRKRLLDISNCSPFIVQNLGRYERHRWVQANGSYKDYIKFILELYHAEPVEGFTNLHGKKGNTFVKIGAVDAPVTLTEIQETLAECKENNIKSLDVLGWEWEMGLHDMVRDEAERCGVRLKTLQIPREVMEVDPKTREEVHFYELAYLKVDTKKEGKKITVTLEDFILENPELIPLEIREKIKNWSDFIDYWAVDWLFNQHPEENEEDSAFAEATADKDIFHNMNQEYRTRKNPKLNLSMSYDYPKLGKYNILVKVIDIFGNDTTKLVMVKI